MKAIDRDDLEMYLSVHREDVLAFTENHQQVIRGVMSMALSERLISLVSGAAQADVDALVGHYAEAEAEVLAQAYSLFNSSISDRDMRELDGIAIAHCRDLIDACCEQFGEPPLFGLIALALRAEHEEEDEDPGNCGNPARSDHDRAMEQQFLSAIEGRVVQ